MSNPLKKLSGILPDGFQEMQRYNIISSIGHINTKKGEVPLTEKQKKELHRRKSERLPGYSSFTVNRIFPTDSF